MGGFIETLRRRFKGQPLADALRIFDEMYVPTRYEALQELQRQAEAPAPAPAPAEPDKDVYGGKLRL